MSGFGLPFDERTQGAALILTEALNKARGIGPFPTTFANSMSIPALLE
jgi:hypothetical protein